MEPRSKVMSYSAHRAPLHYYSKRFIYLNHGQHLRKVLQTNEETHEGAQLEYCLQCTSCATHNVFLAGVQFILNHLKQNWAVNPLRAE